VAPVFIPSNRSKSKTLELLPHATVVNDTNTLNATNFLQSPTFQDWHLPRKRQWIFEYAVKNEIPYYWTIDDDLKKVYRRQPDRKETRVPDEEVSAFLIQGMRNAEEVMDPSVGFLTFRFRSPWNLKFDDIDHVARSGSPAILWNTQALVNSGARFDALDFEEDLIAMMFLFNGGYECRVDGRTIVEFDYSNVSFNDEKVIQLHQVCPAGTTQFVDASRMRVSKARRLMSDGRFLKTIKKPLVKSASLETFFG
jgi:hypothetical protein